MQMDGGRGERRTNRTAAPRTRASRRRHREGFSLVEIMISMAILGIGLLAAAQVIPMTLMATNQARLRTGAVEAAQQQIDELRSLELDAGSLTPGTYTASTGIYNLSWTVADSVPVPRSKSIVMTAAWNSPRGMQDVTLTTYVGGRH
jgi:type IV pilus assembly protein PilV